MIEVDKNYYLIRKDEITDEMEPLSDGLYQLNENLYEVIDGKQNRSTNSQQSGKSQADAAASNASSPFSIILFIFSVLLLAFTVICFYRGICEILIYRQFVDMSDQIGEFGEMFFGNIKNLFRDGIYWILGGVVSLILGSILAFIYHFLKE